WSNFWQIPTEHQGRNIWYRLLHNHLPTASRVHRIAPAFLPSPSCRLCLAPIEDTNHFLYYCLKKELVW
ncbi:hypothetical protein BDB00DRAFT_747560, partial [Zychaea mexicana]|uniref:uncharacterized protein n=1 Tax=Zychaea mexicana TaxID=64656 RepID=UPI0022FDD566